MKKKTKSTPETKLEDVISAVEKAGCKVTIGLQQMPTRFDNDHEHVKLLVSESERMSDLGNKWLTAKIPNAVAAELCLRNGWAYSLAAVWLRCKLKGELLPEKKD